VAKVRDGSDDGDDDDVDEGGDERAGAEARA
jgi:hypothetical protein